MPWTACQVASEASEARVEADVQDDAQADGMDRTGGFPAWRLSGAWFEYIWIKIEWLK